MLLYTHTHTHKYLHAQNNFFLAGGFDGGAAEMHHPCSTSTVLKSPKLKFGKTPNSGNTTQIFYKIRVYVVIFLLFFE